MLSVPRENLEKGRIDRVPAVESGVQKLLDFIYGTKRWQSDPEWLLKKVRALRHEVFGTNKFGHQEPAHAIEDWERKVRAKYDENPTYWTIGRLKTQVANDQPREVVERTIIKHRQELADKAAKLEDAKRKGGKDLPGAQAA